MMPSMTPERWQQVQQVFEKALALSQPERDEFVTSRLAADADLRAEVLRLLESHAELGPLDRLTAEMDAAAASDDPFEPVRVGAWRIDALIGRGGMGSVYRAERADGHYAQRAALKLLRRDVADPDLRRRFLIERRILARIEHSGIARILDGGVTDEGRPWFAMEYVEGRPIDAWCDENKLGVRARLALFREVCAAVQHAHAHLVVHRDIKPANILVTRDGHAKLLDFGIARLLDPQAFPEEAGGTRTGALLLTPGHASPEQLRGEAVGTASDVFQLGVLLFVMLTGRVPRRHEGMGATGEVVGERPSDVARAPLRREIDGDLDTIVLAATRTDPGRRYASVDRLAEDVQRWLDGLPIRARRDTFGYRAGRFVRRHRAGVSLVAALMIGLITFAAVAFVQASRLEHERDRARRVITFLADLFEPHHPGTASGALLPAQQLIGLETSAADLTDADIDAELREIAGRLFAGSSAIRRAQMARAAAVGARILWVDDNPESNRYEIMLFTSLGAEVVTSTSTGEAVELLRAESWDLVLSDMSRDGRGDEGLRLLEWIRSQAVQVPLVFYVMARETDRDRPLGSFGITNQPDELIHLVFDVLERRRS